MRASTTCVVLAAGLALSPVMAARGQAPTDVVEMLRRADSAARAIGRRHGVEIWPGFRPDTIPTVYVLPERGRLLFGWSGAPPAQFVPVPQAPHVLWRPESDLGAASTAVALNGRSTSQVVVSALTRDPDVGHIVATTVHEAFHVFARAQRRDGRRFGAGENSFYVASYPIFDTENEALFALEGAALGRALEATLPTERLMFARRAAAVRRERHARLSPEYAGFDDASELNEGLAQYAYWEALRLLAREGPAEWRDSATARLVREHSHLARLTADTRQSMRLRYYATGPAMARLLDQLDGPAWKRRVVERNWTLAEMLADATGLDRARDSVLAALARKGALIAARDSAKIRIGQLAALRRAQADSVLRVPGLLLILSADSLPGRDFNSCGFDPQNLLQVTSEVQIHTRWWRPCGGAGTTAEFNVPSVHDAVAGTVRAVIGGEDQVRIVAAGDTLKLRSGDVYLGLAAVGLMAPRVTLQTNRADVIRHGDTLLVRPRP